MKELGELLRGVLQAILIFVALVICKLFWDTKHRSNDIIKEVNVPRIVKVVPYVVVNKTTTTALTEEFK